VTLVPRFGTRELRGIPNQTRNDAFGLGYRAVRFSVPLRVTALCDAPRPNVTPDDRFMTLNVP